MRPDVPDPTVTDWVTTPITPQLLRGALDTRPTELGLRPHRLPGWAAERNTNPQLAAAESQPSGVRLVFRTRATAIELDATTTRFVIQGIPPRPGSLVDLRIDGELAAWTSTTGSQINSVNFETGETDVTPGRVGTIRFMELPEHDKDVELWLPHHEPTELVALRSNAPLEPSLSDRRVWLHHGSSISQGSNAESPSATWPALTAASAGVELINLGFSGSALLDPVVSNTIRETPADLISLKIGINIVNIGELPAADFPGLVHDFLDDIRSGHPVTPLLVVSPILCPIHEHNPGPGMFDTEAFEAGEMRFRVDSRHFDPTKPTLTSIRDQLARVVEERGDSRMQYLDGRHLYGAKDFADLPLPDALHPDGATHRRIAERFTQFAFTKPGLFAE